ncbi:DUF1638 domain-containing protein [Desulfosporosinus sp. PR]|uniref:DUF1638 domain-containing protein n=1 Tax=Candidatus Desulfosporosinus nitrosoreducens TaxID=3401928 RepID=UPI0027FDB0EE|nr:DUF1638 domain-containing protein [Desulfosporosinus sp. PR]MDQ7096113.1 DUF1638 domain-containing protein [Desulfosporosinus sp. PR]
MDESIKMIIACEAFRGELEAFKELIKVDILWVEQAMHDVPDKLHLKLEEKIKEAEKVLNPGDTILLFFGNCGGSLRGISSQTLTLIYPDVDDCIPVILGSKERFKSIQAERPGTYYMNKNWIDSGQDPLSSSKKYIMTYGEKKGWKVSKLMYKNYHYFSLIDNGCYELEKYRAYTLEACEKFEKKYLEEKGDLKFVEAILNRLCEMVIVPPGSRNEEFYQSRKAFFPET